VTGDADIAAVAALIGDRTRARFLRELVGGEGRRASELASAAGVSRATASFHLGRLLAANLVEVRVRGRDRSYHLAGPEVAHAIESLQRIAPRQTVRSLRAANTAHALACARFCYDHWIERTADSRAVTPTPAGRVQLRRTLGIRI
jgi:DNA-binding transcriptional ArsR family regulator